MIPNGIIEINPAPPGAAHDERTRGAVMKFAGNALAAMGALLAACSSESGKTISAADLDRPWPFTVSTGTIGCEDGLPYFESEGTRYALNGLGRSRWPYVEPLLQVDEEIWAVVKLSDPGGYVPKIDPGEVREAASALCTGATGATL